MRNGGNMCYVNSVAQVLLRTPAIVEWLKWHRLNGCVHGEAGCMLCALWKTQESLENGTSDRARTTLVKYRAQVSAEFDNESQQDVVAFFGELVDRFKDREIAGGRFGIWGHVQEVHPMVTRGDRSFRLKHPVITHVDRIFRFV